MGDAREGATGRSRLRTIAFTAVLATAVVLAMAVLLGLIEWGIRATGVVEPPEPWVVESIDALTRMLEPCGDFSAQELRGREDAGTDDPIRVYVVGESSAGLLASALDRRVEDSRLVDVRVRNCAQGGASLEHVERRFTEVLSYEPDAVIVLFGHNFSMVHETDPAALALARLATRSHLVSALVGPFDPTPFESDARLVAELEHWLDEAAVTASDQGVTLVVNTPLGNLWYAPLRAEPEVARATFAARLHHAAGRYEQAVAELGRYQSPSIDYELAVLAAERGRDDEALQHLERALDGSAAKTNRASREVLEVIREVVDRRGALLVDADRLARDWAGGTPSWQWFIDSCHPSPYAMWKLAGANLRSFLPHRNLTDVFEEPDYARDSVHALLDTALSLEPETEWYQGVFRSIAVAVPQWLMSEDHTVALDSWHERPTVQQAPPANRSRVYAALAVGFERAGRPEEAARLYELSPPPDGPNAAADWAIWHAYRGDTDAARSVVQPFVRQEPASWVAAELRAPPR